MNRSMPTLRLLRDSLIEPFRLADDTVEDDDEESSEDLPIPKQRKVKSFDTFSATAAMFVIPFLLFS